MKKLIVICLGLLFAIPAMAMADFRTDRAELMASAGLFNVAALDNPVYAKQAEEMTKDSSRGRVTVSGVTGRGFQVSVVKDDSNIAEHDEKLRLLQFTGTAKDQTNTYTFTFFYNNGFITYGVTSSDRGGNRAVTYSQYLDSSRRPK